MAYALTWLAYAILPRGHTHHATALPALFGPLPSIPLRKYSDAKGVIFHVSPGQVVFLMAKKPGITNSTTVIGPLVEPEGWFESSGTEPHCETDPEKNV